MGIMVYSLLWVMQDFVHQPYEGTWSLWEVKVKFLAGCFDVFLMWGLPVAPNPTK